MPALQTLQALGQMRIERNENGSFQRRITSWKPETVNPVAVLQVEMQTFSIDGGGGRQRAGLKIKAVGKNVWRRGYDQGCRIKMWEPDWIGLRGRQVRIGRETKHPNAGQDPPLLR